MFSLLTKNLASTKQILSCNHQENLLNAYLKNIAKPKDNVDEKQSTIVLQCIEDIFYYGLFGQMISSLRQQNVISAEQYVLRCFTVGESTSVFKFLKIRWVLNALYNAKWINLYNAFCDKIAYRNIDLQPLNDIKDFYRALNSKKSLQVKADLLNLAIDGIPVGDLINDTYLRFKPAATLNLKAPYLLILIWQTYRLVRRAKTYFNRHHPKIYLTSYSTYIQHGVPVRVALQSGILVFSFGNYQQFAKKLNIDDCFHTRNTDHYAQDFLKLDLQADKLNQAEAALSARLNGSVDNATAYMKQSAYTVTTESVPNIFGAVGVFLHDFYDSPHVYKDMIFSDFWEWICFTIDVLQQMHAPFFIKPHPNQISLSSQVLTDLKNAYPNVLFVSANITNKQLAEAGMICAVTVYGTVAHEVAYLGVPTIACAHHPHISFDFCKTAKTKTAYADLLRGYAELAYNKSDMRYQSLAFYYMHNLNYSNKQKELIDLLMHFRMACAKIEENGASDNLIKILKAIENSDEFKSYILELSEICHQE